MENEEKINIDLKAITTILLGIFAKVTALSNVSAKYFAQISNIAPKDVIDEMYSESEKIMDELLKDLASGKFNSHSPVNHK